MVAVQSLCGLPEASVFATVVRRLALDRLPHENRPFVQQKVDTSVASDIVTAGTTADALKSRPKERGKAIVRPPVAEVLQ